MWCLISSWPTYRLLYCVVSLFDPSDRTRHICRCLPQYHKRNSPGDIKVYNIQADNNGIQTNRHMQDADWMEHQQAQVVVSLPWERMANRIQDADWMEHRQAQWWHRCHGNATVWGGSSKGALNTSWLCISMRCMYTYLKFYKKAGCVICKHTKITSHLCD